MITKKHYNQEDLFAINDGFYNYTVVDANDCVSTGKYLLIKSIQLTWIQQVWYKLIAFKALQDKLGYLIGGLPPFTFDWTGPNGMLQIKIWLLILAQAIII